MQRAGVTGFFTTRVQLSPSRATHGELGTSHVAHSQQRIRVAQPYQQKENNNINSKVPRHSPRPLLVDATVEDLWLFLATGVPMAFVASRGLDVLIDESYQVI